MCRYGILEPDAAQQGDTDLMQEGGDCAAGRSPGEGKLPAGTQLEDILPRGNVHSHTGSSLTAGTHHSQECEQQVSGVKHPVPLWTSHVGGASPQFGTSHTRDLTDRWTALKGGVMQSLLQHQHNPILQPAHRLPLAKWAEVNKNAEGHERTWGK
jgi:hypothetical protein